MLCHGHSPVMDIIKYPLTQSIAGHRGFSLRSSCVFMAGKLCCKPSYVTRILSLNNFAPGIVESILAGTEPEGMSIAKLTAQPIPEDWNEQQRLYGFPER